ncbi:hypothetical protein CRYUN_Cryun41cG0049000 [Craigia yunnanensis]
MIVRNLTTDQHALLEFKYRIIDPHNFLANNWTTTYSVCNWVGVSCTAKHKRVGALNLPNMYLTGTIPPHLGNLSFLVSLNLSDNNFQGRLPRELGQLSRLKFIELSSNFLSGEIPSWFRRLDKVFYLSLRSNSLTGEIPLEYNISSLKVIDLQNNSLFGSLPEDICRHLPNLEALYLNLNKFSGQIPSSMDECRSLQNLSLDANKFNGSIPRCIGNLTRIKVLYLHQNNLEGEIPWEIGNLLSLERLDAGLMHLNGLIPHAIFNISSLKFIFLANSSLSGILPTSISNLSTSLQDLFIEDCKIRGSIPMEIGSLRNIIWLDLSFNELSGPIPTTIGRLRNLQVLSLHENKLQGSIPHDLCGLKGLCKLSLSTNELDGSLPACLCDLNSLRNLYMSSNKLHSTIPLSFWSLKDILVVDLSSNYLSGSFPLDIGNLKMDGSFRSFDVECEVMSNILHRNLVKVISSCSTKEFKALVLEFMPNGSLEKWLYSCNYFLDIIQKINIMIDVASALEYLHLGHPIPVIHCDLKPSNVLLDKDMVAHVGDFGIAKLLGEEDSMKQTMTLATIGYMAPEYGSAGIISVKSDVYSYGILLMEIFKRKRSSDEIFAGKMSMRHWMKMSISNGIIGAADSNLMHKKDEYFVVKANCISSIMALALDCSTELPEDRIDMKDDVSILKNIKRKFLNNIEKE